MDPNANLLEQSQTSDPDRLIELRLALYEWLAKGGFPPVWGRHWSTTLNFEDWADEEDLPFHWPPPVPPDPV